MKNLKQSAANQCRLKKLPSPTKRKYYAKKYNIDVEKLIYLPGRVNVYWKDKQLNYLGCNDTMAELVNLNNRNEIIGASDLNLPIEQAPDLYRAADRLVLNSNTTRQFYDILVTTNTEILQLTIKTPLKNASNKIVGVFGIFYFISEHLRLHDFSSLNDLGFKINDDYYSDSKKHLFKYLLRKLNITRRQGECLYYLIKGKTTKETGRILAISSRTVESHLAVISAKFACRSKSELIEKAMSLGFETFLLEI